MWFVSQLWHSAQNICWYEKVTDEIYADISNFELNRFQNKLEQKRNTKSDCGGKATTVKLVQPASFKDVCRGKTAGNTVRPWTDWIERACAGDEGTAALWVFSDTIYVCWSQTCIMWSWLYLWHVSLGERVKIFLFFYQIKVDSRRQRTLQRLTQQDKPDTEANLICTSLCTLLHHFGINYWLAPCRKEFLSLMSQETN